MAVDLGWVDIGLAVFLLLSVVIGLSRGFVFELLSLAGWFAAGFAAAWGAPYAEPYIPIAEAGSVFRHGATLLILFVLALVVWGIGARLVRSMIRATPLRAVDRLLGAGFGLVRGLVVLLIVAVVVGVSPFALAEPWQRSQGVAWLDALWRELRPWLFDDPAAGRSTTA